MLRCKFHEDCRPRTVFRDPRRSRLAKLDGSCREYTLPRDDQLSKVKGWTRGDTKIGPVLEVTISYHQGRYGLETRINSSVGDGSHSWVMVGNGSNLNCQKKYKKTATMKLEPVRGDLLPKEDRNKHHSTSNQERTTDTRLKFRRK